MNKFDLRLFLIDLPLRHTFTISRSSRNKLHGLIIRIEAEGLAGWGEAAPSSRYNENLESAVRFIKQVSLPVIHSPGELSKLSSFFDKVSDGQFAAKAGLEMAVIDWIGKKSGQPARKLFGLDTNVGPLTSLSIGIDKPEIIQKKIRESGDAPVLKVKLGTGHDKEIISDIRKWTNKSLWVDANEGWKTAELASEMITFLEKNNVKLIEQPVPAGSSKILGKFKGKTSIPIIADESFTGKESLHEISQYYDGINIKLMKVGGIIPALNIIEKAQKFGLQIMIGCMLETSLANTAAAIVSLNADYADIDGPWLLKKDPFMGFQLDDKYHIIVNDEPGLGVALVNANELQAI